MDINGIPRGMSGLSVSVHDENTGAHDFDNVVYDEESDDARLGMPGMHRVTRAVRHTERSNCLPPDVVAKYRDAAFRDNPALNTRSVLVS